MILWIIIIIAAIVFIAAAWKEHTKGNNKKPPAPSEHKPTYKPEVALQIADMIFSPALVPHRIIGELEYADVDLIPEPDNEYDSGAVKVIYNDGDEDVQLGYLFRGRLQDKVNGYLKEGAQSKMRAYISCVDEDADDAKKFLEITVEFYK